MKLKFTLEVFVCWNVRHSTGKHLLCIVNFLFLFWEGFMLWMILFFWQAACLTFCFSYVSRCLHTRVCVCVSPCTCTTPPLLAECCVTIPAWDHCEVRLLVLFFLLPHPLSHLFSALLCHHIFKNASLFYLQRLKCFVLLQTHTRVSASPAFQLILFYPDFISQWSEGYNDFIISVSV